MVDYNWTLTAPCKHFIIPFTFSHFVALQPQASVYLVCILYDTLIQSKMKFKHIFFIYF